MKEITIISHKRVKAKLDISLLPLEIPEYLVALDNLGGRYSIPLQVVSRESIENLIDDFRSTLLIASGHNPLYPRGDQ